MKYIQYYKDYRLEQIARIKKTQINLEIKKKEYFEEIKKKNL